jgi:hypothetical protein
VDFYESSVEQLKRDIPKYFTTFAEQDRHRLSMSHVLRAVASNEPHALLQYLLFAYAQREEDLSLEQGTMKTFGMEMKSLLEQWTKTMISPIRVRVLVCSDRLTDRQTC